MNMFTVSKKEFEAELARWGEAVREEPFGCDILYHRPYRHSWCLLGKRVDRPGKEPFYQLHVDHSCYVQTYVVMESAEEWVRAELGASKLLRTEQ